MNTLKTSEMSPVKIIHFDGPKKPTPPEVTCHVGQPFELLSKISSSVVESTHGANPKPEWSGAMASSAREMGNVPDVATQFVFGPV